MINVRVRFTDRDGTFWTSAIRNKHALEKLLVAHDERDVPTEVFDDEATAAIAEECFRAADIGLKGTGRGRLSWGPAAGGPHAFTCEIAKEPPGMLDADEDDIVEPTDEAFAPVVGGFPLLDAEPPAGGWKSAAVPAPRELAVFDPSTQTAAPATWLDRLVAGLLWLIGDIRDEPTFPQGADL